MKKKYGFYSVADKTAELIGIGSFDNKQQAIEYFAARKDLDVESFLKIFYIVEIG